MRRRPLGIGAELLPIVLILVSLAGTLGLVLTMHRRAAVSKRTAKPAANSPLLSNLPKPATLPKAPKPAAPSPPEREPEPTDQVVVEPPAPAVDPTKKALDAIAAAIDEQNRARVEADAKTSAAERARRQAENDSARSRRRETTVKAQLASLDDKADALEREADTLAKERDILALERDAAKARLAKSRSVNGGYSVLPNKNPSGTWQRPVVIECQNGEAVLQPKGLRFSLLDLSPLLGPRGSPLIGAVARELLKVQTSASPDGAPIVPYIYFIVRPDGIRPFYEARSRLEPLGIAFGYELVDQDWEIEYPDFDNLTQWDGTGVPFSSVNTTPGQPTTSNSNTIVGRGQGGTLPDEGGQAFLWPADRPSPRATTEFGASDHPSMWPRGGVPAASGGTYLGNDEARSGLDQTNPNVSERPYSQGLTSSNRAGGVATPKLDQRSGRGFPPRSGTPPPVLDDSPLTPVSPEGLPEFGRPEHLLPDPRRPTTDPVESSSDTPRRPATGRVRIDPNVLAEAAAIADEKEVGAANGVKYDDSGWPIDTGTKPPTSVPSLSKGTIAELDSVRPPTNLTSPSTPPGRYGTNPTRPASSAASSSPTTTSSASPKPAGIEVPAIGSVAEGDENAPLIPKREPRKPIRKQSVEVPLDLVVVCRPDGLVIHPGGYRISNATLKKTGLLQKDLRAIVRNHELIDPMVKPLPRLQFLVETGGTDAFTEARRQTILSGLEWPVSIKVSENAASTVFPKGRF